MLRSSCRRLGSFRWRSITEVVIVALPMLTAELPLHDARRDGGTPRSRASVISLKAHDGSGHFDARVPRGVRFFGEQILMLGDSQSVGTRNAMRRFSRQSARAGRTTEATRIRYQSLTGRNVRQLLAWARGREGRAQVQRSRLVIVQLGGNDISQGRQSRQIIDDLRQLTLTLHAANPQLHIAIADIPVRWRWLLAHFGTRASERERTLEQVNAWIRAGGDHERRFSAVPINDYIGGCDDTGARAVGQSCNDDTGYENVQRRAFRRRSADVHLNGAGYDEVARRLRERFLLE